MIRMIYQFILGLWTGIITIVLYPVNVVLDTLIPDLSSVVSACNQFWNVLSQYTRFVLSYTGITTTNIALICSLIILNITIPWTVHGIKLVIKWWDAII